MRYKVTSRVNIPGIGSTRVETEFEVSDDSNVFGRVLAYHEKMGEISPGAPYKLISAVPVRSHKEAENEHQRNQTEDRALAGKVQ